MRKSTKIVKRIVALFLVVLMSINTLGAVVSDNDGSAFITKAEFDSLKNDFQSQIDQYNTSIDAKIDGAIAAYLAGIRVSKSTPLSFIGGIKHFKDINLMEKTNARVDLYHGMASTDNRTTEEANWWNGYEGGAEVITSGTTGKGVFGQSIDDIVDNGKDVILKGEGTFTDEVSTVLIRSIADRGPTSEVAGRVQNWQLSWTVSGIGDISSDKVGTYDYFKRRSDTSLNKIYPICYAIDTNYSSYSSAAAYKKPPNRFAHTRKIEYSEDKLGYLINDFAVNTLYDDELFNGIEFRKDNTYNSSISGTFRVVNWGFASRTWAANDNNPAYREWSGMSASDKTKWILVGNASSNLYLSMLIQVSQWNQVVLHSSTFFDGYNKELYISNIVSPDKIFTNGYTNEVWNKWAENNQTVDSILLKNGIYHWNLRYGNLLVAENVKDNATYTLDVTNNGTSDCYIKFFTGIQSKNFDSVNGINTTKSDATNNNAVKLQPSETVNIKFEVNNSDPVFFKCSDGAEITFGDNFIKEE